MYIGLPTMEFSVCKHTEKKKNKAKSNMPLKQERLYMECLELSLNHRLCTDIISTLVYKNLCTTTVSNSLVLLQRFLLRLCQCWFFRGPQGYICQDGVFTATVHLWNHICQMHTLFLWTFWSWSMKEDNKANTAEFCHSDSHGTIKVSDYQTVPILT